MYRWLVAIAARPDVWGVTVRVGGAGVAWPYADAVHVTTSASPAEVRRWFGAELAPDDIAEDAEGPGSEGRRTLRLWWD